MLREFERIDPRDPLGGDAMLESEKQMSTQAGMPGPDEEYFREIQQQARQRLREAKESLK